MKLRVATYNVHNSDGGKNVDGIGSAICAVSPDVVGIQEIDVFTNRSGRIDTLKGLKSSSHLPYPVFIQSIEYDGGMYGIGMLSRLRIISAGSYLLPSRGEQRVLLHVILEKDGQSISYYNTHLGLDQREREKQIEVIAEMLSNDRTFILTGDFNISDFSELAPLGDVNMANSPQTSFDTFKTGGKIDNIITSRDCIISGIMMTGNKYSDHNMLFGDVTLS